MTYSTINPFTEETIKTFSDSTDNDVEIALDKGHSTFKNWKKTSFAERAKILQKAADIFRDNRDDYAKILTLEMGKSFIEAQAETEISAKILEYYAIHAESHLAPQILTPSSLQEGRAKIVYEPQGIILAIEPWNFPYYQVIRIIAPQLSAGNVVILKHASNVPQAAALLEEIMLKAGLPEGAFQNLYPTHEQLNNIISDPRVRGVALTGSEKAGSSIAAQAGKALVKCTLELGGSDAFIVLEDANIKKAAYWAAIGRHRNAGQVCTSSKRLIVVDSVYDEFLAQYRKNVEQLKMGDPMEKSTTLSPLSSQTALDNLKKQVRDAVKHGARAEEIALNMPSKGFFFRPVILTDLDKNNPARHWEFFGPVTSLYRAKDENEAIEIANDSPYGLGGSIFTSDEMHGAELARHIDTGMVFINHPTAGQADLPFGGVKRSGFGRELAESGIKEFVNAKLICITDIDAP